MPNVIGVFDNSSQAHAAVERMINAGIERDQISLVSRMPSRIETARKQRSTPVAPGKAPASVPR
jgi:hypothetical protein